jgi:hypothetical protein
MCLDEPVNTLSDECSYFPLCCAVVSSLPKYFSAVKTSASLLIFALYIVYVRA